MIEFQGLRKNSLAIQELTKGINLVGLKYLHGKMVCQKIIEQYLQNSKERVCLKNIITRKIIIQVQNGNTGVLIHIKIQRICYASSHLRVNPHKRQMKKSL